MRLFIFLMGLFMVVMTPYALASSAEDIKIERQSCGALYEPSGAVQLLDGRILVVEDEQKNPVSLLTLDHDLVVSIQSLPTRSFLSALSGGRDLGTLADLEAVDLDENGFVYAITSHSRTNRGKRSEAREKLVRFKVDGGRITNVGVITGLNDVIVQLDDVLETAIKVQDVKEDNGFNIEGLSFDKTGQNLWMGLRSPVIDHQAVLLVMKNPKAVFEKGAPPVFNDTLTYLDLDKGGIRSITFDSTLNGYLILSRQEKKGKKFKLWLWDGVEDHAPRRVRIKGDLDLSNAEGIAPVQYKGIEQLMIVFDVGKKSNRKKGCYAFVPYEELTYERFNTDLKE